MSIQSKSLRLRTPRTCWWHAIGHILSCLVLLSAVTLVQGQEEHHEHEGGDVESMESSNNDAAVSVVTITILVIVSILFEMFTETLRESADEMNMPFINTIFSELTTLGFIGLVLFVITKLNVLSSLSITYLGEKEKLLETIETLHMGLFLFIIIFLVLCCGLLKLGTIVQSEWREFERSSNDIPAVVTEYVLATEPPRTWQEKVSITRWLAAKKCKREMVYLAIRRRFLDYRSNHPNPERSFELAKEFQRNPEIRFPFNEYLSIISGEVLGSLIEIDLPTWIALEVFLVSVLVVCWQVGPENELWILLMSGFLLVFLNHHVYTRILRMRHLLTPPRLLKDAERLRHKNEWRARHHLALEEEANEKSWILQCTESTEADFTPPFIDTLPHHGVDMTEHDLMKAQKSLLGGGNGVKVALFSTRLVFLLSAMHLSVFFMRTSHQIYHRFSGQVTFILYLLFLLPSLMVTSLAVQIARDGLYSFTVEHLKVSRIITKVMRILKARQTLRTLRFVAEMKIYLRENVHRKESMAHTSLPMTATLHESTSKYAHVTKRKEKPAPQSPKMTLAQARRKSISSYNITTHTQEKATPLMVEMYPPVSPPLSPMAAYYSPREKRSDAYKLEMERREINTIFCLFDLDGSGSVSRQEMSNLLLAITHELDQEQLNRLMMDLLAGQETQEEITFESFYNWCHQHIHESTHSKEDLIQEIFNMIDTDGSGYITVDEFIAIFKTLGQSLDHDDVRELVYQMDRNDDGKIDLEEFSKMLQKHEI